MVLVPLSPFLLFSSPLCPLLPPLPPSSVIQLVRKVRVEAKMIRNCWLTAAINHPTGNQTIISIAYVYLTQLSIVALKRNVIKTNIELLLAFQKNSFKGRNFLGYINKNSQISINKSWVIHLFSKKEARSFYRNCWNLVGSFQ